MRSKKHYCIGALGPGSNTQAAVCKPAKVTSWEQEAAVQLRPLDNGQFGIFWVMILLSPYSSGTQEVARGFWLDPEAALL